MQNCRKCCLVALIGSVCEITVQLHIIYQASTDINIFSIVSSSHYSVL